MHVSLFLCLLFSLFSTCFCSMCVLSNWQTDWCGDVSSFPLSSFSLHFSSHHSLRHLWRLWLKSERERQRTKEKQGADGKGKSLLLWQRTQLGSGQRKSGLWRWELWDSLKCSVQFFSSNNVSSSGDVLSLCGVLLDSSADSYRT